jgi:hypothetical protein
MKGGVASFDINIDYGLLTENIYGNFENIHILSKDVDASLLSEHRGKFNDILYSFIPRGLKNKTEIFNVQLIKTENTGDLPEYPIRLIYGLHNKSKNIYNILSSLKNTYEHLRIGVTLKSKPKKKSQNIQGKSKRRKTKKRSKKK